MNRITKLVAAAALGMLALGTTPAGAAAAPRVSAELVCEMNGSHVVDVVESFELPAGAHPVWLNVSLRYRNNGLRVWLTHHERVTTSQTTTTIAGEGRVALASVHWHTSRGTAVVWHLKPLHC